MNETTVFLGISIISCIFGYFVGKSTAYREVIDVVNETLMDFRDCGSEDIIDGEKDSE